MPANQNITIKNVHVILNRWAGSQELPLPNILGNGIDVSIDYDILGDASRIASVHKGSVTIALKAAPAKLGTGRATTVTWATQADACSAGGAWSGSNLPSKGSRSVTVEKQGENDLTLSCHSSADSAEAKVALVAN